MTAGFVPFDAIWTLVISAVESAGAVPEQAGPVYLVRNLRGQVRVAVSEEVESDAGCREALDRLATHLRQVLGAHGTPDGGWGAVRVTLLDHQGYLPTFAGDGREDVGHRGGAGTDAAAGQHRGGGPGVRVDFFVDFAGSSLGDAFQAGDQVLRAGDARMQCEARRDFG